jgi:phosphinothricin acetyltransferase
MPPTVRLASDADLQPIVAISNWAARHTTANFAIEPETEESWTKDWRQTHEMYPWLVAVDDHDQVTGFAKGAPHRGRCSYAYAAEVTVYVHPDHHRRGIGTSLYRRLIELLRAQGYVTLLAGIALPNPASVALHEAAGFTRAGVFHRVGFKFGTWHDVGYWQLSLRDPPSRPGRLRAVGEVDGESDQARKRPGD